MVFSARRGGIGSQTLYHRSMAVYTEDEIHRMVEMSLAGNDARVTLAALREPASDAYKIKRAITVCAQACMGQNDLLAANLFFSSARGRAVERLGLDRYGARMKPAAPARGVVLVGTPTPGPEFVIPEGTEASAPPGRVLTTRAVTVPANLAVDDRVPVPMQSLRPGANQIFGRGTIARFSDPIAGAPNDMIVEQRDAFSPGADQERVGEFKQRAPQHWRGQVWGTADAMEVEARAVPGVVDAVAIASIGLDGRMIRAGEIVIADPMTLALIEQDEQGGTGYQVRADELAATVLRRIERRGSPFAAFITVTVAGVTMLPIRLGLHFAIGANVERVSLVARAVAVNYCNLLRPGQAFVRQDLSDLLADIPGVISGQDEVVIPQTDVVPAPEEVYRTSPDLVSVTLPSAVSI